MSPLYSNYHHRQQHCIVTVVLIEYSKTNLNQHFDIRVLGGVWGVIRLGLNN